MLWRKEVLKLANVVLSTQPYKGTRDFYHEDMRLRNWFFGKIRAALELAAFDEYNGNDAARKKRWAFVMRKRGF